MSELRWILLIAGFALIAGIYFWGSRGRPPSADEELKGLLKPKTTPKRPPAARPSGQAERAEPLMTLAAAKAETRAGESDLDPDERYEGLDEPAIGRREANQSERGERQGAIATRTFGVSPPSEQPADIKTTERPISAERPEAGAAGEGRAVDAERSRTASPQEQATGRAAPREAQETMPAANEPQPKAGQTSAQAGASRAKQKILALRVVAPRPSRFDGGKLADVLREAGLTHGQYDIFHRLDSQGRPLFSLASLVEPGTFDPETMAQAAYPGVALFSVMPGPQPPLQTFDQMVKAARLLAAQLDGSLLDEAGAPLNERGIEDLREKIAAEQHQLPGDPEPV